MPREILRFGFAALGLEAGIDRTPQARQEIGEGGKAGADGRPRTLSFPVERAFENELGDLVSSAHGLGEDDVGDIVDDVHDEARIDGAGPIRSFFAVTVPLVSPTIFMVLILLVINGLQIFDLPAVMVTRENPAYTAVRPVLEFYYRYTFNSGRAGLGSAVIVVLLAMILVITAVQFLLQRRWVHYE